MFGLGRFSARDAVAPSIASPVIAIASDNLSRPGISLLSPRLVLLGKGSTKRGGGGGGVWYFFIPPHTSPGMAKDHTFPPFFFTPSLVVQAICSELMRDNLCS